VSRLTSSLCETARLRRNGEARTFATLAPRAIKIIGGTVEKAEIPIHADFERAPGVLEGATTFELSTADCDLDFWIKSVAHGALVGLDHGKRPGSTVPSFLREPGPLRDNLIFEFAFRSLSEWEATRICAMITWKAPDIPSMEFYATQTLDEARHAQTFRHHLVDLGVPEEELIETAQQVAGPDADRIFPPLWEWAMPLLEAGAGFIEAVVVITVLLEGVLAPTTELSELKWKAISPATADIERGACVDEIRHLAVGSWIVRDYLMKHPEEKPRLARLVEDGRNQWAELPTVDLILKREQQFQEGIELHRDEIGTDYEIFPGRPLVDTTVEERLMMALKWSADVQDTRLRYMGLEEAIPEKPDL
jgi:hypothetical protein